MRLRQQHWMPAMGDGHELAMSRFNLSPYRFHGIAYDKAEDAGGEGADAGGSGDDKGEGDKDKGKKLTSDELTARLEKSQADLKRANAESAERRRKLEAYEADEAKRKKDEEDRKTAELTELQKAQKERDEAKAEAARLADERQKERVNNAIEKAARGLKFRDEADAVTMIDRAKVKIAEDGTVSGIKEALEELVKAKPYLVETTENPKPGKGTPPPKTNGKQPQPGPGTPPATKPLVRF